MLDNKVMKFTALLIISATTWLSRANAEENPDQVHLVSSIKKKVGAKGPTYVFKLYSLEAFSNFWYRVDVSNEDDSEVLQSEKIRNGVPLESKAGSFQIVDVDSDGYCDIKVLGGEDKGKTWFKIWLYDPSKRVFVWSKRNS